MAELPRQSNSAYVVVQALDGSRVHIGPAELGVKLFIELPPNARLLMDSRGLSCDLGAVPALEAAEALRRLSSEFVRAMGGGR
jgi:hypothetical protein